MKKLFLVLLLIVSACGVERESSDIATSTTGPKVGLLVMDGTNQRLTDNTILAQFYRNSQVSWKTYIDGADLAGSNLRARVELAKLRVCDAWARGVIDELILVGYSRGAAAALTVAQELGANLQGAPQGCPQGYGRSLFSAFARLRGGTMPRLRWIGLVDPVNTLNADMPPMRSTAPLFTSSNCLLIYKQNRNEGPAGILNSLDLAGGCSTRSFNYSHVQIAQSQRSDVLAALQQSAQQAAGVRMGAATTDVAFNPVRDRQGRIAIGDSGCRVLTPARRFLCEGMGCTWKSDPGRNNPNGVCQLP